MSPKLHLRRPLLALVAAAMLVGACGSDTTQEAGANDNGIGKLGTEQQETGVENASLSGQTADTLGTEGDPAPQPAPDAVATGDPLTETSGWSLAGYHRSYGRVQ